MTPIQQAILTLAKHLHISVIVSNEDKTQVAFSGAVEVDATEIAQLIEAGLITLGHKTGRIKVVAQPEAKIVNN